MLIIGVIIVGAPSYDGNAAHPYLYGAPHSLFYNGNTTSSYLYSAALLPFR